MAAVATRRRKSKRNPEGAAASMYSSFHGVPSTVVDEYYEKEAYHGNLAALGELVGFWVRTVSGYDTKIEFGSDKTSNPRKASASIKRRPNAFWPFDSFPKTTIYHVPSGHKFSTATKHGGHTIYKSTTKNGYVVPSLDRDSVFDSTKDAKKFIDHWAKRGNPKHRKRGKSVGPVAASQKFVGDTVGAIYRPMNEFVGMVGGVVDKGFKKVGIKGNGRKRKANPDHVLLCSTEDGKNLILIGGDQSIDLDSLKIDGPLAEKELVTVGEVWGVNYVTEKVFGDGGREDGLTEYVHIHGPKETKPPRGGDLWADAVPPKDDVFGTGELPTIIFDKRNRKLILSGGMYFINQPLMGTSAGIEN